MDPGPARPVIFLRHDSINPTGAHRGRHRPKAIIAGESDSESTNFPPSGSAEGRGESALPGPGGGALRRREAGGAGTFPRAGTGVGVR